jgi:uncharacterized membrane protein
VIVVLIAYLLGLTNHAVLLADTNSQIAARVSPRLIDLVAALATGAVGAFGFVTPRFGPEFGWDGCAGVRW